MKVKELKKILDNVPDDLEVFFSFDRDAPLNLLYKINKSRMIGQNGSMKGLVLKGIDEMKE